MKKALINSLICAALMSTNTYAATNPNIMFQNLHSSEWKSTPDNVKNALKNIQVMSGSSAKDMMSVNWLNELKRSPSTYGLHNGDVQWVNSMIDATKGSSWNPQTKVKISPQKKEQDPVKSDDKTHHESVSPNISKNVAVHADNDKKVDVKETVKSRGFLITRPVENNKKENTSSKDKSVAPKVSKSQQENEKNIKLAQSQREQKLDQKKIDRQNAEKKRSELIKNKEQIKDNDKKISLLNEQVNTLKTEIAIAESLQSQSVDNKSIVENDLSSLNVSKGLLKVNKAQSDFDNKDHETSQLTEMVKSVNVQLNGVYQSIIDSEKKDQDLQSKINDNMALMKKENDEFQKKQLQIKLDEQKEAALEKAKENAQAENAKPIENTRVINNIVKSVESKSAEPTVRPESIVTKSVSQSVNSNWRYKSILMLIILGALAMAAMSVFGFIDKKEK